MGRTEHKRSEKGVGMKGMRENTTPHISAPPLTEYNDDPIVL